MISECVKGVGGDGAESSSSKAMKCLMWANMTSCQPTIRNLALWSFILLYLLLKGMSYAETGGGAGGDDLIDLFGHE